MPEPLLACENLTKYYPVYSGLMQRHTADVKAVESVSLSLKAGQTLGLVGESGCGKSTLARLLLLLETPTRGTLSFGGRSVFDFSSEELLAFRRKVQVVFQDPFASLNPRMSIEDILADPLRVHQKETSRALLEKILAEVGLPSDVLDRYPHEFSGGQQQRIGIARALVLEPELLICDEAVSALDVSVQAQILNLLVQIQQKRHLSILFISHDLEVVHYLSDWIAVMYLGQIVESGPANQIFEASRHPYTKALLEAAPRIQQQPHKKHLISGELPSPLHPPSGCYFHPRCLHQQPVCATGRYFLTPVSSNQQHLTRCPFALLDSV